DVRERIGRAHLVDRHDVRVIQGRSGTGFPLKAPCPSRVQSERFGQDFQSHVPLEARIPCPVHLSHASDAEPLANLVATQANTRSNVALRSGPLLPHRLRTDSVETPPT